MIGSLVRVHDYGHSTYEVEKWHEDGERSHYWLKLVKGNTSKEIERWASEFTVIVPTVAEPDETEAYFV